MGFHDGSVIKYPPAVQDHRRHRFDPWVGKLPWSRKWQPRPLFLPGDSHGQRNPGGPQSMGWQRVRRH